MSGVEKTLKKSVSVSQVYSHSSVWRGPEFVQNALKPGVEIDVETTVDGRKKAQLVDLTVITLAGRKYLINCDAKKTVERNILPTVLAHEGIGGPERLLFGLARLRKGDMVFLEPEVPLSKYLNEADGDERSGMKKFYSLKNITRGDASSVEVLTLFVRFRVYILPDVFGASRLVHLLYLQTRHDVMEGSIMVSKDGDMFELASLAMQAEIGDIVDYGKLDYFLLTHYLPTELPEIRREDDMYLKRKLASSHKKWRGLAKSEAERKFLSIISKDKQFGQQFFSAEWNSWCEAADVDVGVSQDGVHLWTIVPRLNGNETGGGEEFADVRDALPSSTRRLRLVFPWSKVEKVSYDAKRVSVKTYPGCEGELPRKFKFKPMNVANRDFFFVAHMLHDVNVRLRKGLARLLLSKKVWGTPESRDNSRSSDGEDQGRNPPRGWLRTRGERQAVVLSPENRVVPLFRCNSADMLEADEKPSGKKLIVRHQSEYMQRRPANVRRSSSQKRPEETEGEEGPDRRSRPPPKYVTRICISGDDPRTNFARSTSSASASASVSVSPSEESASMSTPSPATSPLPALPWSQTRASSSSSPSPDSDSGVCEAEDGSGLSLLRSRRPDTVTVGGGGVGISVSMIANCSRVPVVGLDSSDEMEAVIEEKDDSAAGSEAEEEEVDDQERTTVEIPPEDGVDGGTEAGQLAEHPSIDRVAENPSPSRCEQLECSGGSPAVRLLDLSTGSDKTCDDWNWQDETVSQSLLERFALCGIGPERKILHVVLRREEDDMRPWGLLVTEKEDKGFYVACMPFISIAARSGLIREGDRLLRLNGKDLVGLSFCDVLREVNSLDDVMDLVLSRQVISDCAGIGAGADSDSVVQC